MRAVALSLATLTLITCGQDTPLGLGSKAGIRLTTSFPSYSRVAPLAIDHVGIIVSRFVPPESSEIVYHDTVAFSVNRQTLRLDDIRVDMDDETMDAEITIQLLAGSTLLYQGSDAITLIRGQTADGEILEYSYSGLGNNLTSLQLSPRDTVVNRGAAFDFGLNAFDIQGADVPQYYVGWALSSGAAGSADINAVGHLTASSVNDTFFVVVTAANGIQDSARVIVSNSTTAPSATLTWTGAASDDFSAAGNWSPAQAPGFNDSLVIGAAASQRQPSLSAQAVVGAISIISGGTLTIDGLGLSILRGLSTSGTGVLNMTFPEDIVVVQGDVVFDGGNELDLLTDGVLSVAGNLTQRATNSGDSFHPSGNHTTILLGANPTLSFASPGLVAGTSHFQRLAWIGTGTLTLATQVLAHDELVVSGTGAAIIASSNSSRLTVATLASVGQLALNNVPLTLQQTTANSVDLLNVTFQNMPTNVSQLVVSHPGGQFSFDNITFSTTPVAPNGFYIDATDINGQTDGFLTIDMNTPTPTSGGAFVKVSGGAVVNWPSGATTVRTWSGASNANWGTPANWVGGVVPGPTDSAVIVSGQNQPAIITDVTVGAVNVASGTLDIEDATVNVARGFATSGTGTLTMQSGSGLTVGGNVTFGGGSTAGLLTDGTITVAGNFSQTSGTSTQSFAAGVNNRVTLDNTLATVSFASPGSATSHFGILEQGNNATGFTFASNVTVTGTLEGPDGFSGEIFGSGVSLTLAQGSGCCVDLNGVVLIIDDPTGNAGGLSGVTFTNVPTTATQLTIRSPGNGSSFSLSSINWRTLSAGNTGSYLDVTDINGATGGTLAVTVTSNDPGNGPTFTKTGGGALAFWPASPVTWTGAISNDMRNPQNWNSLRVPFQDNVVFPAGTANAPVLSTGVAMTFGDLTVAAGQTLNIQTATTVNSGGNVSVPGNITASGTGILDLSGTAKTLSGNISTTRVSGGSYTLNGNVTTQTGASFIVGAGALTLGGHTLRTGVFATNSGGLFTMTNPLDSIVATSTTTLGGGNETGLLTAGTMVLGNTVQVSASLPTALVATGTHKVVFNQAGNQAVALPAATGARFQNAEINVGAASVLQTTGGPMLIGGNLQITQGSLAMNGQRVDVTGDLSLTGTSTFSMTHATDTILVGGNATFSGGSTTGLLTNGVLKITGNFTQNAANSTTSFSPSGLHKTVLGSAAASDVSMGSPGAGAAGSHFQVLDVTPATGGIILDVNMQADSLISTAAAARIESPLVALTARRVQVTGLTFFNTRFTLDEQGGFAPETFSNVTFNGYPANSTGLVLFTFTGPGGAAAARPAPVTANVNFTPQLGVGAGNFYVDLTSSNGFQVNLTMTGSNQGATAGGNGTALTRVTPGTGVATVAWP